MNGAELLVLSLENEGVDRNFGVAGEETLDIVESLRLSSIKLILTRHEQAKAFMAATSGRLTGNPGVCLTTLGSGALNLTTGAAFALLGGMPIVMITGQKGILTRKQARFQVVDVVATTTPHKADSKNQGRSLFSNHRSSSSRPHQRGPSIPEFY
jgi:acetolactate synthase-1/2/3 large subunit